MKHVIALSAAFAASLAFSLPAAADHGHCKRYKHSHHHHAHGGKHRHYHGGHRHYRHYPAHYSSYYPGTGYSYPVGYVARAPRVRLFCPVYGAYYPRVSVCPAPWQEVVRHAAVPVRAYYYPG